MMRFASAINLRCESLIPFTMKSGWLLVHVIPPLSVARFDDSYRAVGRTCAQPEKSLAHVIPSAARDLTIEANVTLAN
jgi:hypothetical protein